VQSVADPGFNDEALDAVRDITAAGIAGDETRVYELAKAGLDRGLRHPVLFHARANWFWHQGLYYDALVDLEAALGFTPRNPLLLKAAGECLLKLGVWNAAARAFGTAVEIVPNMVHAHYLRGLAFQMNGARQPAIAAHKCAIELMPRHAGALGSLALISVAEGNAENVRSYAGRAHLIDSQQPTAHIALALLELNEGAVGTAQERVRELLRTARFGDDPRANDVLREIGDCFGRLGNLPFAFHIYTEVNRKRRAIHAARFAEHRSAAEVALQTSWFERSPRWNRSQLAPAQTEAPASHVFILGFARTGTTLLETVLASNAQVVAFDEKDCFPEEAKKLLKSEDGLETLAALDPAALVRLRDEYWEKVREFGRPVAGKIFVDKWPFNSRRLPLIAKLFPEARILFVTRDPRDVVLSCFRRSFIMNSDTFEFLQLEDCARLFSAIMSLVALLRDKLPLHLLDVRYENLVNDFDTTVSGICDFVGLRWNEAMRDFSHAADGTVDMSAQSGKQVRMGLYSGGSDQWRRFREQLAPAFPILAPWVERLGYSD
jgi:tetratricopeptide (TPR) repeat protein